MSCNLAYRTFGGKDVIKRFKSVEGRYVEKIYGQDRYGYAKSDFEDFYDLIQWAERGGYSGLELLIYDFETGEVHKPFEKKRNVVYGTPVWEEQGICFLKGDYDERLVTLYRYLPEKSPEKVTELSMDEINLYNLDIIGNPLHIISQEGGESLCCYYPERFSFDLGERESVALIEDGKVYIQEWVEEGWDTENDCATEDYQYYNRILVKDFAGNTISEEIGCLFKCSNGDLWIC